VEAGPVTADWLYLSDSEVKARLRQRGCPEDTADTLVWRARGHGAQWRRAVDTISRVLAGEPVDTAQRARR
jgi:hypothetical protein